MLEATLPWGSRVRGYRSRFIETSVCEAQWQRNAYWNLRRCIFVEEQSLFQVSDRDERDAAALPIVAMSTSFGMPDQVIGVVRIYPVESAIGEATWYGGRLGVDRAYRRHGVVGEKLIKRAVGTARGLGCQSFLATVQAPNVRYFERYNFEVLRGVQLYDTPHALMRARVERFEPLTLPAAVERPELAA